MIINSAHNPCCCGCCHDKRNDRTNNMESTLTSAPHVCALEQVHTHVEPNTGLDICRRETHLG